MAFIDELIKQGLPYGMEIETPKAHDEINSLIHNFESPISDKDILGMVMGTGGGGKGELMNYLLAMLTGGAAGTMAQKNIPAVKNISNKLTEFLVPEVSMPSKEELDMDFKDIIRDKGYPAEPEMWEMGESY